MSGDVTFDIGENALVMDMIKQQSHKEWANIWYFLWKVLSIVSISYPQNITVVK